jgi:hypothetical protein
MALTTPGEITAGDGSNWEGNSGQYLPSPVLRAVAAVEKRVPASDREKIGLEPAIRSKSEYLPEKADFNLHVNTGLCVLL